MELNSLDKFDVDAEVWLNKHILRMKDIDNLRETLKIFGDAKPKCVPYILERFKRKKCHCCNNTGFIDDNQAG